MGLRRAGTLLSDNKNKSGGWQGGELNQRLLPHVRCFNLPSPPAFSIALRVPETRISGVLLCHSKSQPSVCSFNCVQTPFFFGWVWGRWADKSCMTWRPRSDQTVLSSVKPVWTQSANQASLTKVNDKVINKIWVSTCKHKSCDVNEFTLSCTVNTSEVSQFTLIAVFVSPRVSGKSLKWWLLSYNYRMTHWCLSPKLVCSG